MSKWLEERVHRLRLSVDRLEKTLALPEGKVGAPTLRWYLRKESWICLKRALALWWGLRWGRKL